MVELTISHMNHDLSASQLSGTEESTEVGQKLLDLPCIKLTSIFVTQGPWQETN